MRMIGPVSFVSGEMLRRSRSDGLDGIRKHVSDTRRRSPMCRVREVQGRQSHQGSWDNRSAGPPPSRSSRNRGGFTRRAPAPSPAPVLLTRRRAARRNRRPLAQAGKDRRILLWPTDKSTEASHTSECKQAHLRTCAHVLMCSCAIYRLGVPSGEAARRRIRLDLFRGPVASRSILKRSVLRRLAHVRR